MKLKVYSLLSLIFLLACTQKPKVSETRETQLFPEGIYTQNVRLEIKIKDRPSFPFTILSKIENRGYHIKGYDPFGGKAFESKGHLNHPERNDIKLFIKLPVTINKKFVEKTLATIQKIQRLTRNDLKQKIDHQEFLGTDFQLRVFTFNQQGIPASLIVETPKWKAYIELSHYTQSP